MNTNKTQGEKVKDLDKLIETLNKVKGTENLQFHSGKGNQYNYGEAQQIH